MSRITKWKLEKTKLKVVFRLQFHATHIPLTGWDKLFISFTPADSGKTTAKTSKANVRNGTCKWADPIYETTRLLQDSKSKQYDEKLYKIIVAMGSSRASTLGEATINLADYVDALKPSVLALPIHGCNSGTILHVTVQLLTSKTGFREFEQQRELTERGLQSGSDRHGHGAAGKTIYAERVTNDQVDKVGGTLKFKADSSELSPLDEGVALNEEYADSAGFDGSSNNSETLCLEKHESSSPHEIGNLKNSPSTDLHFLFHSRSPCTEKGDQSDTQNMVHASNDSAHEWGLDYSLNNEFAMAYEENNRLRGNLEIAELSFTNLKQEVGHLQILADELGTETQQFSHLLAAEISSTENLAKELSSMKSECVELQDDMMRLKDLKLNHQTSSTQNRENRDDDYLVHSMRLRFSKGISIAENKIRELQNKTFVLPHDRFIYSELEALLNILQDVKHENIEAATDVKEIRELCAVKDQHLVPGAGFGLDLCPPESILQHFGMTAPVSELSNPIDAMKGQMLDLVRELDEAKIEKEALTRKMDQMECYYEGLITELEENQKRLLGELQHLRNEHSTCLYTLSANRAEMEAMRQEMNDQMLRFADERHEMNALNKELERRATASEAALRRARLNYSIAVDKLQKDLELLSSQVVSMFETNENLIKQAFIESSPAPVQEELKLLENSEEDDVMKLSKDQNKNVGFRTRSMGSDIILDDLKRSVCFQEELYQKVEEELIEMFSVNLNLDIYSKALQESLLGANLEFGIMKEKMDQLVQELELRTVSEKHLMVRLQKATDDIQTLSEYKASCISQCSNLSLQIQLLEDKLESASKENDVLAQKLKDSEIILTECRSFKSKYEACLADNAEISLSLKQEVFEKDKLQNETLVLIETLMVLKSELDELVSLKKILEENIFTVQNKLANFLMSCNKQFCVVDSIPKLDLRSIDIKDAVLQFEKIQHNACERIFHLMEDNRTLENEKVITDASLSLARSQFSAMKQKFKIEMQDMVTKLDLSNALLGRLQVELESVANKIHFSSEVGEEYAEKTEALLADLSLLEHQMQELTCKNGHFDKEISALDALAEEIENSKSTIAELLHEKQDLAVYLQDKNEKCIKLSSEIGNLEEKLRTLQDELHMEKGHGDVLEKKVRDLTSQLNEEKNKALDVEQQRSEFLITKELASDLEQEKSRIARLLVQRNEMIEKLQKDISCQSSLESQLFEMQEYALSEDVKTVYLTNQYETLLQELLQQFTSSDRCLTLLQERYHGLEAKYKSCLAREAHWSEEKSGLLTTVNSIKSEFQVSEAQNKLLSDSNISMRNELEECKGMLMKIEKTFSLDRKLQVSELGRLKSMVTAAEEEADHLSASKEELEILVLVLKGKVAELSADITLLEEYKDEVAMLRAQCDDISRKLSEQVLKTEEFKNLSSHLKELKDKAEADCIVASEKREAEVPTAAVQESLRMAFIKEQCETKVQELKQQLSISKKHGEEMLLKLQDAVDEIENRKKSDAVNMKRNEELSLKLMALETELQSTLTEKRENMKAYDRTKAELECALLTLECCKEEKEKCEANLLELEAEKSQLAVEFSMVKEQLENLKSSGIINSEEYGCAPDRESTINGPTWYSPPALVQQDETIYGINKGDIISILAAENADPMGPVQFVQDAVSRGMHQVPVALAAVAQTNGNYLDFEGLSAAQKLRSSMEHLHEELEKMKNENSVFEEVDPDFQVPESEIMKLRMANEELKSLFPLFDEVSSDGNALERVLALEIELAEALKAKNRMNMQFQSSFLKQHSDEESVLRSFRDINELIKEMLDIKGRHVAMEMELRDMHNRYSQLSLQFAEVEGERQKLQMTLKNFRSPKKLINRSFSANVVDHPL